MNFRLFLASAALVILVPQVAPAGINLGDYNLITTGNLTDNSDVQGRVLVGGTLNSNSFTFGGHLSNTTQTIPVGIFNALGSNVTAVNNNGTNYIYGSGGKLTQSSNAAATGTYTSGLSSYLASVSSGYAALATNSTVSEPNNNQITFNATPTLINGKSVAVFSLDQSFFNQSGTVSGLTGVVSGETVVINVTGGTAGNDTLTFGGLNFSAFQNASNQANIIFNFINATSLSGINNLGGSILAVNADINTGNSLVGSVYVKSISAVGEVDRPFSSGTEVNGFSGYVPATISPNAGAVPEPASIVMVAMGGLAVAGFQARRRRVARA